MYAIIENGGKQYRVAPGETVRVESIAHEIGDTLELTGVGIKAVSNEDGKLLTGSEISTAKVTATVSKHGRGEKLIVFKFKRKKQYRRTYGHRQNYTELTIDQVTL
ncbi:MAG: 50S ribosomal protein L21 [Bryobacteraceae bacterium]|nr:50S ribosomal protein L21 [Bryobacteraceae bacterium]